MDLDEIDRKIVSQLQIDGRTSLKELNRIVGYTSMGVKKRVKNLFEQDVIMHAPPFLFRSARA